MNYFKQSIILLAALILSSSCKEDRVEPVGNPEAKIEIVHPTVSKDKGQEFVKITAQGNWTLDIEFTSEQTKDWAYLSVTEGSGSKSNVVLSYEANTSLEARELQVVLKTEKTIKRAKFTQNAKSGSSEGGGSGTYSGTTVRATSKKWMELPATSEDDNLLWAYHNMSVNGKTVRNFSYYYDTHNLISHWVAYPLNNALKGSGSRTNAWDGVDPNFPNASDRPILDRGFSGGGYDRGHQCPSADRLTSSTANAQTFYATNMTSQASSFNQNIWAGLEGIVRGWASKCDTLYVVTGCVVAPNSLNGPYKEPGGYNQDNVGKKVAIPVAYYKAVLRYKKSEVNEGYGYGGYCACAVYLEHDTSLSYDTVQKSNAISIKELEEKTGIDFFVNLPAAIGAEKAAKVESQNPQTVGCWW